MTMIITVIMTDLVDIEYHYDENDDHSTRNIGYTRYFGYPKYPMIFKTELSIEKISGSSGYRVTVGHKMYYIFERQALWGYQIWYWEGMLQQSQKVNSISASAATAASVHQEN